MPAQDTLNDIVTIQNVDDEPHDIVFDSRSYGLIDAGQTRRLPRFLASHAMKHIIDHVLNKQNKPVNNQIERRNLADKILVGVEKVTQSAPQTESDLLKERVAELNSPSDLDLVVAQREVKGDSPTPPQAPPDSPAPTPPAEMTTQELEALLEQKKKQEEAQEVKSGEEASEQNITDIESVADNPKADITRDELYKWAENEMGMTIYADEKSKKELDDLPLEEVKSKIGYTNE